MKFDTPTTMKEFRLMNRHIIHILARQAYNGGEQGAHNVYIWELASILQRAFWKAEQTKEPEQAEQEASA